MTEETPQERRRGAVLVMFLLFTAGVFLFPLADWAGYAALALSPIAGAVKALGYPHFASEIRDTVGEL